MYIISKYYISPEKRKIAIILCLIIVFLFHLKLFGNNLKTTPIKSSSPVVLNSIDINGKKVSTQNNKASLILFFNPLNTNQKMILSYARILFNKYHSNGLMIIGISTQDKATLKEFSKEGCITFPLISDPKSLIFERFKMKNCCGGTIVINKEGSIKFSLANLVENNTLRQLIEKELIGNPIYNSSLPKKSELFKLNNPAPPIHLLEITSKEVMNFGNFGEDYLMVTFFSTMCPACKTGRRVSLLKEIDRELRKNHVMYKSILVFFRPFDKNDISNWEKSIEMPYDKFLSDDIFSEDERYFCDGTIIPDPFTILLDKKRKVIYLEPINSIDSNLFPAIIKAINSQKL